MNDLLIHSRGYCVQDILSMFGGVGKLQIFAGDLSVSCRHFKPILICNNKRLVSSQLYGIGNWYLQIKHSAGYLIIRTFTVIIRSSARHVDMIMVCAIVRITPNH